MYHTILAPIATLVVFLLIYRPKAIVSLTWSGKLRFKEIIYNINRETGFFPIFLEGFQFKYTVDLGCGYGLMGQYLQHHTLHLVGVDMDGESLEWARRKDLYDELFQADLKRFEITGQADSIFLIEVLEHLDRKEGEALLQKLQKFPFVCITTPTKFHVCSLLAEFMKNTRQKHQSLWNEADFEKLGYTIHRLKYTGIRRFHGLVLGNEILAVRGQVAPQSEPSNCDGIKR